MARPQDSPHCRKGHEASSCAEDQCKGVEMTYCPICQCEVETRPLNDRESSSYPFPAGMVVCTDCGAVLVDPRVDWEGREKELDKT